MNEKMFPAAMAAVFVLLASSAGSINVTTSANISKASPRIHGGEAVKEMKNHPYAGSLQVYEGVHICTGSIIHRQVVLTSSHCAAKVEKGWQEVKSQSQALFPRIRVGSPDVARGGEIFRIDSFHFNGYDENGLALIKLFNSLDLQSTIERVELAGRTKEVTAGTPAVMVGWGQLGPNSNDSINVLQSLRLKVYGRQKCKDMLKYELYEKICAKADNKAAGPCAGDEGSPLVVGKTLIGVVGGIPPKFECGRESDEPWAYTPVAAHRQWIDKVMKEIDPNWLEDSDGDDHLTELKKLIDGLRYMFIMFFVILMVCVIVVLLIELGFVLFLFFKLKKDSANG